LIFIFGCQPKEKNVINKLKFTWLGSEIKCIIELEDKNNSMCQKNYIFLKENWGGRNFYINNPDDNELWIAEIK
jgi:hypothetical protein